MEVMVPVIMLLNCQDHRTDSYRYTVPSNLSSDPGCEQGWYTKDGEFLSDGNIPKNKMRHVLVIDENKDYIILSKCIELNYHLSCDQIRVKHKYIYRVLTNNSGQEDNRTTANHNLTTANHNLTTAISVFFAVLFVIGIVCFIGFVIGKLCQTGPKIDGSQGRDRQVRGGDP